MTKAEIKAYQKKIKRWIPKGDVTMKDVVVHGLVDHCVDIANESIKKMIDECY